jgi:hypothetical protein
VIDHDNGHRGHCQGDQDHGEQQPDIALFVGGDHESGMALKVNKRDPFSNGSDQAPKGPDLLPEKS